MPPEHEHDSVADDRSGSGRREDPSEVELTGCCEGTGRDDRDLPWYRRYQRVQGDQCRHRQVCDYRCGDEGDQIHTRTVPGTTASEQPAISEFRVSSG